MNILAFETSHAEASVALLMGESLFISYISSEKRHEETVMPAVAALMERHGINPSELDLVCADIGPGSFTGIRIGVCHANAIADAGGIACIGICSLEAMAAASKENGMKAVCIDAGNNNCYGAIYDSSLQSIYGPAAENDDVFLRYARDNYNLTGVLRDTEILPDAGIIASLAKEKANGLSASMRAMPLYLRPSQAERKHGL